MNHERPFIVLWPQMPTNPTKGHVVVRLTEWLAISLGEQDRYSLLRKHPNYDEAAADRDRLIQSPGVCMTRPETTVMEGSDA